jgi:gas vesicle protein
MLKSVFAPPKRRKEMREKMKRKKRSSFPFTEYRSFKDIMTIKEKFENTVDIVKNGWIISF